MKKYWKKKIFVNENNYVWCRVYADKKEMQRYYEKVGGNDSDHYKCSGVALNYERWCFSGNKKTQVSMETGTVLLHLKSLGAGIVSHEFMHAVLWAHKHKKGKNQYPIIIKDMKEEEEILHNHTYAVRNFYSWYWKYLEPKHKQLINKK